MTEIRKSKQYLAWKVWVISIWNLRFVWDLMLGIWDFIDSMNDNIKTNGER
jgi:hypothetical protein